MKVKISRAALLTELTFLKKVPENRTSIPVLSYVLLEASGNTIALRATDLEVTGTSKIPALVSVGGSVALPFKIFRKVLKATQAEEIELVKNSIGTVALRAEGLEVLLHDRDPEDFPVFTQPELKLLFKVELRQFLELIEKISFCVPSEESRVQIQGALVSLQQGCIRMVATDGHRLAIAEASCPESQNSEGYLIAPKALVTWRRFAKLASLQATPKVTEVCFQASENQFSIALGDRVLSNRRDGRFPDYAAICKKIEDAARAELAVDRLALIAAIRAAYPFLRKSSSQGILLDISEQILRLKAADPDRGEVTVALPIQWPGTQRLGVSAVLLQDALEHLTEPTVILRFEEGAAYPPVVIKSGAYRQLVMGVRFS